MSCDTIPSAPAPPQEDETIPSAPAPPQDEPIFSLAGECEMLFQKQQARLEDIQSDELRIFEEHQQRFIAWTAYMGVFAKSRLCLDRKLRHHTDLQDLVLRLLDIVKLNLAYIVNPQAMPSPVPADDSLAGAEAPIGPLAMNKDALDAIDGAIDRLNRLGIAIRQSSTRELMPKGCTEVADFNSFKELAAMFVKTLYPSATIELQDHLSNSMAERFNAILFRQSQHARLRQRRPKNKISLQPINETEAMQLDEDEDVATRDPTLPYDDRYHGILGARLNHLSPAPRRDPAAALPSEASMSSIDRQALRRKIGHFPNAGSKKKQETSSIHIGQVGYPKAPQNTDGTKYITCEWCFETRENEDFEGEEWRKHVDRDMKPYICISEACSDPTCSFGSFKEWQGHMLSQHGRLWHQHVYPQATWVCAVCSDSQEGFKSQQELHCHMETTHDFTEAQLDAILRQSRIQARRRPNICPLCNFNVEDDPKKATGVNTAKAPSSGDDGKRQQEPLLPESSHKRARISTNVEKPAP
ncbi:hypothetical protein GQ53DRAFT_732965, partial [Thozetella sp. PMI_491]